MAGPTRSERRERFLRSRREKQKKSGRSVFLIAQLWAKRAREAEVREAVAPPLSDPDGLDRPG